MSTRLNSLQPHVACERSCYAVHHLLKNPFHRYTFQAIDIMYNVQEGAGGYKLYDDSSEDSRKRTQG